jgi:hypothetical protein
MKQSLCKENPHPWSNTDYYNLQNKTVQVLLLLLLFMVYLTTLFQYLRLYSVDFYSILIRLPEPSSSEARETWVRRMAAEFCLRSICFMLVRFFYMP